MKESLQRHFETSDQLCAYVRKVSGDTCILSFSLGKDSFAALVQCRRYFKRVVPFYLEHIPGISFVEKALHDAEAMLGEPVLRYPHPTWRKQFKVALHQPPERIPLCDAVERLPPYTYSDVEDHVRATLGLPEAFVAIGTRTADSPIRFASVRKYGSLNPARRSFFAVYDWKKERLITELRAAKIRLPVDYDMFGRSFDGIDFRFLEPIRRRFPEDFKTILRWFPLADADLARRIFAAHAESRSSGQPLNHWLRGQTAASLFGN